MELQHFLHEHPLVYKHARKGHDCYMCREPVVGDSYSCIKCKHFNLHKSCAELPRELHHPLHRKHPLVFIEERPYNYHRKCYRCKEYLWEWLPHFSCLICQIYLHIKCASLPPLPHTMEVEIHDHSILTLLQKLFKFTCDACGKFDKGTPYLCLTCLAFWVHPTCASLHRTVRHVRHKHTLNLTYSLQAHQSDHQICELCVEKVDTKYGVYYCSTCNYVAHLSCAADGEIMDNINVPKVEDTLRNDNPEFDKSVDLVAYDVKKKIMGEDGIEIAIEIKHFSHEHDLILTHELKKSDKCDGCVRPILTPFYSCTQCSFVLHKFCVELPRKKWHPLHEHPLTLSKDTYHDKSFLQFVCSACSRWGNGFTYNCLKCSFFLDVNCSLISDRLTHDGHEHGLILSNATRNGNCCVCDSKGYVFRCADCAFALDFKCATLPKSIRYGQHEHPFTLQYTLEDDSGEYYCDICEEERDQKPWFYYCADCSYPAHSKCILGNYPNCKSHLTITHNPSL